jgi:hypothetical protein
VFRVTAVTFPAMCMKSIRSVNREPGFGFGFGFGFGDENEDEDEDGHRKVALNLATKSHSMAQ